MLDKAAGYLQQHRNLRLEILGNAGQGTPEDPTIQARITAIRDYLSSRSQIAGERTALKQEGENANAWTVNLRLIE